MKCLTIAWWSPWLGALCHFKPNFFVKVEDTAVKSVEKGIEEAKDLIKFDLTYNPVSVTYRYINASVNGQPEDRAAVLSDTANAYKDVFIGFDESVVNLEVKIFDILSWHDVAWCLIKGGATLAKNTKKRKGKRDGRPSDEDAKAMAKLCLSEKFKKITGPAFFNITGKSVLKR